MYRMIILFKTFSYLVGYRRISSRISKKDNRVGQIDKSRITELERLLTGTKQSNNVEKSEHYNNNTSCTDFITYDQIGTAFSRKDHTSNTNMRDSYFEVPSLYTYNGVSKKMLIKAHQTTDRKQFPRIADSLNRAELEARKSVIQNLKLSTHPLGLNVTLERIPVYFDQYPFYRFICGSLFRRDQHEWHCRNSHCDISSHLNGWLTERCPLAMNGCPHVQFRLKPGQDRTVKYSREFSCFKTSYATKIPKTKKRDKYSNGTNGDSQVTATTGADYDKNNSDSQAVVIKEADHFTLLDLPTELLVYLVYFLDNLSMNCLAKTCTALRELCCEMVDKLGIVVIGWCKKSYQKSGSTSWQEDRKVCVYKRFFTFQLLT